MHKLHEFNLNLFGAKIIVKLVVPFILCQTRI